jgi:ferric-dicitrate binding protein FerR (iron transport regulator)
MEKYFNFSIEEFLQDDEFVEWVLHGKNAEAWEQWLDENAERADTVEKAREILLVLHRTIETPSSFYTRIKDRIDATIKEDVTETSKKPGISRFKIAAIISALIVGSFLISRIYYNKQVFTIKTQFAETKQFVLPDGSVVMLNANSEIKYFKKGNRFNREVWLKGEGFFKVRHRENSGRMPERFVVHSGNLSVEVLGTEFNVSSVDRDKTEVLLTAGQVRLWIDKDSSKSYALHPNDFFSFNKTTRVRSINKVLRDSYISWLQGKCNFEKMALKDLCKKLQQYYGKPFKISDKSMENHLLSGTLELEDKNNLLRTLSALLDVEVIEMRDYITISPKQQSLKPQNAYEFN